MLLLPETQSSDARLQRRHLNSLNSIVQVHKRFFSQQSESK